MKDLAASDDRIVFTGFVQGRVLSELLSNCYMYVLPSDLEGMPLTLLEAMSYGQCCLVSDIPECMDFIGDKALTFHKGDVQDLKAKMHSLLANYDTVQAYRAEASDYVCNKYNWDKVVEQTLQLYTGEK